MKAWAAPTRWILRTRLVVRDNPATPGPDGNYLRYTGGDHVVLGGTDGNDILIGGIGDDTLWGDAGNDRLESGPGSRLRHRAAWSGEADAAAWM